MVTKKKIITGIKVDDAVPNHIHLQGINFGVELGSFNVGVVELANIGLHCMKALKDIEKEG